MGSLLSKAELESALARRFGSSIRFRERPEFQFLPTSIAEVDEVAGGLPRGALTEVFGPPSSGRTSLMLAALAVATAEEEICALVDTSDAFSPHSAAEAGVALDHLLWVRCGGNANHALKTLDLLLQGGGFGLVVFDLGDIAPRYARKIPLSSWFRFRRVVENTPTALLAIGQEAYARSCSSLVMETEPARPDWQGAPCARVLRATRLSVSRRKPVQTAPAGGVGSAAFLRKPRAPGHTGPVPLCGTGPEARGRVSVTFQVEPAAARVLPGRAAEPAVPARRVVRVLASPE